MARCHLSIDIAAPPPLVWAISQEPSRRPEWDYRVREARLLTPLPIARGSVLASRGWFGFTFTYEAECINYEPPRKCAVKVRNFSGLPIAQGAGSWQYEPLEDGGCRFVSKLSFEPSGPLRPLTDALFLQPLLWFATWRSLRALKRLAERELHATPASSVGNL